MSMAFLLTFAVQRDWRGAFEPFRVPAFSYPGADARNIQSAAHCLQRGVSPFDVQDCIRAGEAVKAVHPAAEVPTYNYPAWWAHVYAWFGASDERFFLLFWAFNAAALTLTIAALCWRFGGPAWAPVLLFNPVTLLTIERGNIDGLAFAATACVWVWGPRAGVLTLAGLLVGGCMKVFPLLGLPALLLGMKDGQPKWAGLILLLALPLLGPVLAHVPDYLAGTSTSYTYGYGLTTWAGSPKLKAQGWTAASYAALVLALMCLGLGLASRSVRLLRSVDGAISRLAPWERTCLAVSLLVFAGTFFLFSNWAYRLVFLVPSILICWKARGLFCATFALLCTLLLWGPWLHKGWELQTKLAYLAAPSSAFILWRIFHARLRHLVPGA